MSISMNLTEDEAKTIADIRETKVAKDQKIAHSIQLLEAAAIYAQGLVDNDLDDTDPEFRRNFRRSLESTNSTEMIQFCNSVLELTCMARSEAGIPKVNPLRLKLPR